MKPAAQPVAAPRLHPFLSSVTDNTESVNLCCDQMQAIAERLIDVEAHAGWSEEDLLRVMKREGAALEVFRHHLQSLLAHHD